MKEGWMKNDEGWRMNDEGWWFQAVDRQTNQLTDEETFVKIELLSRQKKIIQTNHY